MDTEIKTMIGRSIGDTKRFTPENRRSGFQVAVRRFECGCQPVGVFDADHVFAGDRSVEGDDAIIGCDEDSASAGRDIHSPVSRGPALGRTVESLGNTSVGDRQHHPCTALAGGAGV